MLPIAKTPSYLSPSSLSAFEDQPNRFYMERMSPVPWPKEPQGLAAAAGSSFDAQIKVEICKNLGITDIVYERVLKGLYDKEQREHYLTSGTPFATMIFESSVEPTHRGVVLTAGDKIKRMYASSRIYKDTQFVDVELHHTFTLLSSGTPLFMKLDGVINLDDEQRVPLDWKVQGFASTTGASPKPGYKWIQGEDGMVKGPHEKYSKNMSFHDIDAKWGDQLCTYGWGLGKPPLTPFRVVIHALVVRPTGVRIAVYEGWITVERQRDLMRRYEMAWYMLKSGEFVKRLCSESKLVEFLAMGENWWGTKW
jgi:hypothetical protein